MEKPRILIGLGEVCGYGANLKKGFRQLGVECDLIDMFDHRFKYGGDDTNLLVRWLRWLLVKRVDTPQSQSFRRAFWYSVYLLSMLLLLLWALPRYDAFIFLTRVTFLKHYDLPLLKLLNKKIVFIYPGTERAPYICGSHMELGAKSLTTEQCIRVAEEKKKSIHTMDKYADVLIDYPPTGHFHERPFVLSVVVPYEDDFEQEINERDNHRGSVRILHAPSNPKYKGTSKIREVIKALESKGHSIEFVEIIEKPHSVVLEELLRCDFVVDELYNDSPLGTLGTEAAFHGKPTITGGYYAEQIYKDIQADWIPPSHFCHPDEIEQAIEKMIVDKDYRLELGRKAKAFVETHCSPKQIASQYLQLIEGNVPQEWLYDPKDIRYLHGCSISESRAREVVRAVIEKGGVGALQLEDKPGLRDMFVAFAFDQESEC